MAGILRTRSRIELAAPSQVHAAFRFWGRESEIGKLKASLQERQASAAAMAATTPDQLHRFRISGPLKYELGDAPIP